MEVKPICKGTGVNCYNCNIELNGTEKIKTDLKEIEDTLDRIISKYDKIHQSQCEQPNDLDNYLLNELKKVSKNEDNL